MTEAPRDRQIWTLCDHDADTFFLTDDWDKLTIYAAHVEGLSHRPGLTQCVAEFGGGYSGDETWLPDWWYDAYSEFELPVNPIAWMELPPFHAN